MTMLPLTTVREAIRRVLQRLAACVIQRPMRAGDLQPDGSSAPVPDYMSEHAPSPAQAPDPAPEPPPAAAPDYLPTPSQLLSHFEAEYQREVLANLVQSIERLFHDEWTTTLHHLRDNYPAMFAPNSTFLEPGVADEYAGWESRGEFLAALRDGQALVHGELEPASEDASAEDPRAETTLTNSSNSSPSAHENVPDHHIDALNAMVASRPLAKCQPPDATPGSYTWTASHTWEHAGYGGLQCQDCGERFPRRTRQEA
jgi:hypothetical protein